MAELKVYLANDLDEKFRRIAMTVYGFGKGSLSKAAAEAILQWCIAKENSPRQEGKIREEKADAVADKRELPKDTQVPHDQVHSSGPSTVTATGT